MSDTQTVPSGHLSVCPLPPMPRVSQQHCSASERSGLTVGVLRRSSDGAGGDGGGGSFCATCTGDGVSHSTAVKQVIGVRDLLRVQRATLTCCDDRVQGRDRRTPRGIASEAVSSGQLAIVPPNRAGVSIAWAACRHARSLASSFLCSLAVSPPASSALALSPPASSALALSHPASCSLAVSPPACFALTLCPSLPEP